MKGRSVLILSLSLVLLVATITAASATSGLWGRPGQLVTIYTSTITGGSPVQTFHRILPNGTWETFSCSASKNFVLTGMRAIFLPTDGDLPPFRLLVKVSNLTIFACELGSLPGGGVIPAETGSWVGMTPLTFEPGIHFSEPFTVEVRKLPASGDPDLGAMVRGWLSISMFGYFWP